jgi:transposase
MEIKEFYAQSLNLMPPWKVAEVAILEEQRMVEVRIECCEKVAWIDPESEQRATIHGWRERRWRHLDTCEFETWVVAEVPRVKLSSGKVITVQVPWAEALDRFTQAMERRIVQILQLCPAVTRAARVAGISRDQAEGVMQRAVERGLMRREHTPLELVGIDEKALRKGHRYATILTDLVSGHVIEVCKDRTKEGACEILRSLPASATKSIEAVAMDMWPAYIAAVEEQLPEAAIVFDRFHVKKYLNDGVDKVRRQEHRELSAAGNLLLKGTKYQWLKTHEDMRRKSALEFRKLLVEKLQTGTAWSLRELFDHFWSYRSTSCAMRFFYNWIDSVNDSGLKPMIKAAQTLQNHLGGLLNYITFPISNASAEGINSIIQGLKTAARGLPKFESFRARILFHLGGLSMEPL